MFGLKTYRHRLFETSFRCEQPWHQSHDLVAPQAKMGRRPQEGEFIQVVGNFSDVEAGREAMGIDWMTRDELSEAIPPAYGRVHRARGKGIVIGWSRKRCGMTDMIEIVARAICKSRTCEGQNCCQWPANTGRTKCPVKQGGYDDAAREAIKAMQEPTATALWRAAEEAHSMLADGEPYEREIERLRRLLIDAPVLIIDERNARALGEQEALVYMQALRAWHPKVQAALGLDEKGTTLTSAQASGDAT